MGKCLWVWVWGVGVGRLVKSKRNVSATKSSLCVSIHFNMCGFTHLNVCGFTHLNTCGFTYVKPSQVKSSKVGVWASGCVCVCGCVCVRSNGVPRRHLGAISRDVSKTK